MNETKDKIPTALLVGVQLPKVSDVEVNASLAELERLVTTLGYQVVGKTSQKRTSTKTATVLGDGKLKEIARWTGGSGVIKSYQAAKKSKASQKFDRDDSDEVEEELEEISDDETPTQEADVVIFDVDLSPSQLRNLESATGVDVLDRTGVIIEIFNRHARTRAAKLQVEIARLIYVAPRMRETGGPSERQAGKGAGESSLELDRRKIRDRIKELKNELEAISKEHGVRRAKREQEITVALVGYTNAGKSSLMRALTGSEILVADKLFATLDTTVRILYPESVPRILVSDTVGFIKKLPHDLVASFKSTLDEALNASLLLQVVDASDPTFRSQMEVTQEVLSEVGTDEIPMRLILNKVDRLSEQTLDELKLEFPDAIYLSAHRPQDVAQLRLQLISFFEEEMVDREVLVPYESKGAIGEIRGTLRVLSEDYNEKGVLMRLRGHEEKITKVVKKFKLITL